MEKLKLIFIGTDGIGCDLLRRLQKLFDVPLVVTGQDKPAGRKLELHPSPVKLLAEELDIEVFQPLNINAEMSVNRLANLNPDMIVVMAYGQILSREVLDIPKIACLNVHASLLPRFRGASPIQSVLLQMERKTGISLMKMVSKMDAGPVYRQFETPVSQKDTALSLSDKLGALAAEEIPRALIEVEKGLISVDQNEERATYCGKISKADGLIDWRMQGREILSRMRAFDPWPGTFTFYENKRLKVLTAETHEGSVAGQPGLVKRDGIVCGDGLLTPLEIQIEGGKIQSFHDFINGHSGFIGSILGQH